MSQGYEVGRMTMTPICSCCAASPEHTITDARGRSWRFEQTRMFGPVVLRADGNPKSRQPGSRSAFWAAWEAWREAQHSLPRSSHVKDAAP